MGFMDKQSDKTNVIFKIKTNQESLCLSCPPLFCHWEVTYRTNCLISGDTTVSPDFLLFRVRSLLELDHSVCRGGSLWRRGSEKRRWFSGRIFASHAKDPGSIPGLRRVFLFLSGFKKKKETQKQLFLVIIFFKPMLSGGH